MAAPYILARSLREAHAFARDTLGLRQGHYRIVNSSGTLKSVRNVDLYLVPGWRNRYDRFAMQSAIRWTRMNVIDLEKQPVEAPADPRGPLTDDVLDLAYAENAVRSGQGAPGIVTDGLEPPGVQPTLDDDSPESFFDSFLEPEGWEPPATLDATQILRLSAGETGAEVAPTPEPEAKEPQVKRRRRRCKECGILVEPDNVDQHAEDHKNDLVGSA